jgi:putative proteasome-type protease
MTYCVGMRLDRGIVFMSDTRTNAGVDNISTFRKMFTWEAPGHAAFVLMTAGNLATTQAVVSLVEERMKAASERSPSILDAPSMFQAARLVASTLKQVIAEHSEEGQRADTAFGATMILGGQIEGSPSRLFLIYPEGNFIEASAETPYFQVGETKYGRPILVRGYDKAMSFESAIKLLTVSFDSTIKANLSVGLPLDVQIYGEDSLRLGQSLRIDADDAYFQEISNGWGDALKEALNGLPDFRFEDTTAAS